MGKVQLQLRGRGNPAHLHVRYYLGRRIDIRTNTGILINPAHWDSRSGNYRTGASVPGVHDKRLALEKLKVFVIESHNEDYMRGEIIDSAWLKDVVSRFFKRPKHEGQARVQPHLIYFYDFMHWWVENKGPSWRTGRNQVIGPRALAHYKVLMHVWRKYDKGRMKIYQVGQQAIDSFIEHLEDDLGYSPSTVKRHSGRVRFFLARAEAMGIRVSSDYKERVFVTAGEEVLDPYLSEQEVERIFRLDLCHDEILDNIRDNVIIGAWTGLRISDLNKNLSASDVDEDYINIRTQKTKAWVTIPKHPHVRRVLDKRGGELPPRYSNKYFNEKIKVVCMLADIDQPMQGRKFDSGTRRKKSGVYKKYELISAHTLRRSFATNLHGVVPNHVIMDVGGWKTEDIMLHYVKRTRRESAEQLKSVWNT